MTRDEIQAEFEKFFEFDTDDRSCVTSVSCRLFAEHIAALVAAAVLEKLKQQEPAAWHFCQQGYWHFTDEKRDWYDAVNVEEVIPLYAAPVPAAVPDGLIEKIKEYGNAKMAWGIGYGMDVPPEDEGPEILAKIEAMLSAAPAATAMQEDLPA